MSKQLHYVVSYNLDEGKWEIDWDSTGARFDEGNMYDKDNGWSHSIVDENVIIQDLNNRLNRESK